MLNKFKVIEHKSDNYDNVVRIKCSEDNSNNTITTPQTPTQIQIRTLTIDVHKKFYEALGSKCFQLTIASEIPQELKSDYVMNCIVIKSEKNTLLASCHGLLFLLEGFIENKEGFSIKVDDNIILLFDILDY